jgi:CHAT domain-containing protein
VQAAIPAQAALVEFARYRPLNPKYQKADERFGAPRYVAYVLHPQGEAQWVELGEAKAIDEAIGRLRQALRDKRRRDVKQLAREVDERVMRPVRALLGQTRRVFISPDGALNLVPFAALVDEYNRYLIQRYNFSYLTSGRDLLRLQVKQPNKQTALVVANPDFGEEAKAGAAQQRLLTYRPGTKAVTGEGAVLAGYYFPPLQGTADEARALKAMLADATVLVQAQATEAALKQISSPRILHVATHGFFLENQQPSAGEDRLLRPVSLGEPAVVGQIENPLLRSGLALAGANRQKNDAADDGILTAQEATGLDLWGTKLVVLSACDTGVGEVKNGEGVYGLRRALVLAGSETQVMSLWPVSDKATRDLIIEYYRRLLKGEGRSAALRQVQLQMLAGQWRSGTDANRLLVAKGQPGATPKESTRARDYSHPYYWASFIQSGEWANLDGKR